MFGLLRVPLTVLSVATLMSGSTSAAPQDHDDYSQLPVIPDVVRLRGSSAGKPTSLSTNLQSDACPQLTQLGTTSLQVGVRFDPERLVTELYVGDFSGARIVRHDITASLAHTQVSLPIAYGGVWAATDLDGDKQIELVVQRGDVGFGGDGWLDILSAPDWRLRAHVVFPGMKVFMHATPVNIDMDPVQEIFAVPSDLGGFGYAVIVDYDAPTDSFYIRSQIVSPPSVTGNPAIADFDDDGRVEIIQGTTAGYALFEWQDTTLALIRIFCDTCYGNHIGTAVCRPRADGRAYALLGNNDGQFGDFHYDLMLATADNEFTMVHTFFRPQVAWGITPCGAADIDCDGLDELVMDFYPDVEIWEWDETACAFVQSCGWTSPNQTVSYWHTLDLNQNGVEDLGGAISNSFLCIGMSGAVACDTVPPCPPPADCHCPCFGDPYCDSVVANIQDVIRAVDIAFRSGASPQDPDCPWQNGDVTCEGVVDVTDVVRIINVAFRGSDMQTEYCVPCP